MRRRTWKVIAWSVRPTKVTEWVPLDCPCGYEAECPVSARLPIISVMGMRLVFDPPDFVPPAGTFPDVIQCRKCGRQYV